jgi:hypothetical protein
MSAFSGPVKPDGSPAFKYLMLVTRTANRSASGEATFLRHRCTATFNVSRRANRINFASSNLSQSPRENPRLGLHPSRSHLSTTPPSHRLGPHHPSLQSLGGWHSWPHFPWWAHSFLSLARWSIPSHVPLQLPTPMPSFRHPRRRLTPICNLQKAPNPSAIAMPAHHGAAQTPQNQTAILPPEQAAQILSQSKRNTIAHRSRTSHSTLRKTRARLRARPPFFLQRQRWNTTSVQTTRKPTLCMNPPPQRTSP